jgi:hypothetical protein
VQTSVIEMSPPQVFFLLTLCRSTIYLIWNNGKQMHGKLDFPERGLNKVRGKET